MRFLVFTLYAPMAGFGAVAVGAHRTSWARPARSAILGLIAGALGIERAREEEHRSLDDALGYGVRTLVAGRPLLDYHTAQTPKTGKRGHRFATRREELEWPGLATVLSSREYRTDACFSVALWGRPGYPVDLDGIAQALRLPGFCLFVGRKSAPLGLPMGPALVEAATLPAAFEAREHTDIERHLLDVLGMDENAPTLIACDLDAPGVPRDRREERRRDAVASRARWQFADRTEAVFAWPEGSI